MQVKIRRVRDPDYWGLPYNTPIKPGMKPKPHVPNKPHKVRVRKAPAKPKQVARTKKVRSTGAALISHVMGSGDGQDGVNYIYTGPDMSTWPKKVVKRRNSKTPWDYKPRKKPRPVHPLEPHLLRDRETWGKTGIDLQVVNTSPNNPGGMRGPMRMWVWGNRTANMQGFPFCDEMNIAMAKEMGLRPRRTIRQAIDDHAIDREYHHVDIARIEAAAHSLLEGIRKAPAAQPDLFRGIGADHSAKYLAMSAGDTFTIAPTSFTRDPLVASMYSGFGMEKGQVIFHVLPGSQGVSDPWYIPSDQEVVTGGKFRVVSVGKVTYEDWDAYDNEDGPGTVFTKSKRSYTVIDVEQVAAP